MADILVLAFFGLARLHGLGGIAALQNLHPRFFIGADDEASLLVEAQRMDIELTDVIRLGLEVWIVAIEPVHAPMRLEVCLLQDTPDAGATQGCSRCCGSAATRSSRLHRVAGQCNVAGFLVAIDSTPTRSEGGNALRATRAWCIL